MIRVQQVKFPVDHTREQLEKKLQDIFKTYKIKGYSIWKKSLDAREKKKIRYVYTIDVDLEEEDLFLKSNKNPRLKTAVRNHYTFPKGDPKEGMTAPVVVGLGPAGLFCALMLARAGRRPLVLERGKAVLERREDVEVFWKSGMLDPESNVSFGEGGAGTFSDGKLNTQVKDKSGRNRFILKTLVEYGAPSEILYESKPHIGTDLLSAIVSNIRKDIEALGGTVRFHAKVTGISVIGDKVFGLSVNETENIFCDQVIFAPGHSARDTFTRFYEAGIPMVSKPFAIGVRIEHPKDMIDEAQYGAENLHYHLPAASYKMTYHTKSGRGVYTFCMCPGGYVVNASTEPNMLVTNGMSEHARNAKNSNSAVVVNVTAEDFGSEHPLAGIDFQRTWEKKAYIEGFGCIPIQRFADFKENIPSKYLRTVIPEAKGAVSLANIRNCLPEAVSEAIVEGIEAFGEKIKGFSMDDVILSGVETRTSSPVRIPRDEDLQSEIRGLYPCGEGAGYAGGIMSAAMDGVKVAEAVVNGYVL